MTSEHHGGFAGYSPNPLQVTGWLLEAMRTGWCAPCPMLLPLRPVALVAEEVAWLAARFPGRVAVGRRAGRAAARLRGDGGPLRREDGPLPVRPPSAGRHAPRRRPRRAGRRPRPPGLRRASGHRDQHRHERTRGRGGRRRPVRASSTTAPARPDRLRLLSDALDDGRRHRPEGADPPRVARRPTRRGVRPAARRVPQLHAGGGAAALEGQRLPLPRRRRRARRGPRRRLRATRAPTCSTSASTSTACRRDRRATRSAGSARRCCPSCARRSRPDHRSASATTSSSAVRGSVSRSPKRSRSCVMR